MKLHNSPNNGPAPAGKTVEITSDDLNYKECECGSDIFFSASKMGVLSVVHPKNSTGKPQYISVPALVCVECNSILKNEE